MDDQQPKKKPLSEIGHLFLSDVRDRHLGGAPRPQRTPPGGSAKAPHAKPASAPRTDVSIDLTPEEYAQVFGGGAGAASMAAGTRAATSQGARRTPPMTAILGEHLNGKQFARVKEYARHLAAREGRVGLIELDGSEFRLMCFEADGESAECPTVSAATEVATEAYDPRAMAEAVEELNFDVDRWLLLVPSPRVLEAQPLLALVDHWVLLTTCDHDGVVSSYRMLKGMADLGRARLTLAVLDAHDEVHAAKVHNKLAGVCEQFLGRALQAEPPVRRAYRVAEHLVMLCRPNRDKAQLGNPPQWAIVEEFLAKAKAASTAPAPADETETAEAVGPRSVDDNEQDGVSIDPTAPTQRELVGDVVVPTAGAPAPEAIMAEATPVAVGAQTPASGAGPVSDESASNVLDLPSMDASAEQIVSAVLKQDGGSALLECPVRPPMCADARLAVTREHGVVLVAVAGRGLNELRSIGQAYRWLVENRSLIGMAVPQLAIDAKQTPHLRLLVDRRDANADVLQPMLGGDHVTVQSYRRLKWGQKAGLLLEAA